MKLVKFWLPPVIWAILIYIGSSIPSAQVSENRVLDFIAHKALHLFEYAVLYLFVYRALVSGSALGDEKKKALSFLLCLIYALSDEFHQRFVPGREGRIRDVFIDLIGAYLGVWVWKYYLKVREKRSV